MILANTQGEIRVGPSHQAKLPLLKVYSSSLSSKNDELSLLREEPLWKNKTTDIDLSMYLQAARSIAAFAGMCDRGLAEDMYEVAERDDTTINALTILHNHDYDCKRAIQALVKCPIPKGIDRKWSDDDQKKFIKGLRQYGKNFFRIRKDLLPHKQTSDLVEFYYLWKKTPQAQTTRSRRRQRPCSTSVILSTTPTPAKQRNTKNNNNNNNNKDESEHNSDNDDNQMTTDFDEQYCRHCQIASKNLQIAGHDNQLLCYSCRIYYEKSGQMPIINLECSPYLFKPLNRTSSTCTNSNKRKRSKPIQSPNDNNSLSTRSKKKTCLNEKVSLIKQKIEEEQESTIKKEIKLEEQENEKPSSFSTNSSLVIKTEDLNLRILTPTPCKQEFNSPSSMLSDNTTKILIDHTKQNNTNALITSPSSAFSRTSKQSLIPKISDESNSSLKSNTNHSTILNNNNNVSTVISKDNDLSNDDENISDNSTNCIQEFICDQGPSPLICEKECYNRSQEIILLQVYDRSKSQNSCARTDIILKRRLPIRQKQTEKQQDLPSSTTTIINVKQEDRNLSKLSFSLDKGRSMHHQSGPPPHPLPTILPHHDSLLINRNNPLFHPLPLHGLASGSKPSLGFPSPFGPSPHENATLRHIDPLSLRLMNPAAAAAQYFAGQPPFPNGIGRPTHAGLDPATAAFLFDPHCRGMISPFANTSPSSIVLPPPPPPSLSSLNNSLSSSKINNGAPNHAHIHSHSRTHLHLANSNESSSNTTNGAPLPPSTLLPFANPFSGLSHGNPLLDTGGSLSVPINFEAIHNLTRERELMALILANNSRFDPMTLGLVNSLQMSRYDDFSRMNLRERTKREHNENVYRRLNLDNERQQLRFPFHHPPEELLRRF
ncbi:unnamed protein product [Rotaria sp. Silwood2]|nr:unnamed protein product [Rotaria sp. Silwood2]